MCVKFVFSSPFNFLPLGSIQLANHLRFLETMYRGRDYYILSSDSSLLEVECAVTRSRDVFRLRWDTKKERPIQIQKILQMRSFKDGRRFF